MHYVVTEHGIATIWQVHPRTATALIELAHPHLRPNCLRRRRPWLHRDQTLQNLRAYPVEEEQTITPQGQPHGAAAPPDTVQRCKASAICSTT